MIYIRSLFLALIFALPVSAQPLFTLEDLWLNAAFVPQSHEGFNWMDDGVHYSTLTEENGVASIRLYHIINGFEKVLVEDLPKDISFSDYSWSPGNTMVLLSANSEPIYRRSYKADYFLYDLASKKIIQVNAQPSGKISYAEFSPDGKSLAYVRDNNLYLYNIVSGKEKAITADGKFNEIINGSCDWVYEEEFEFAKAFFWSPDSKKIAFYRFDESQVKIYNMQTWGNLYPEDYRYKYPKAGEKNSDLKIMCYFIDQERTEIVDSMTNKVEYFPRVRWTGNPDILSVCMMNRLQNWMTFKHWNINTKFSMANGEKDNAYIEINDHVSYLKGTDNFIFSSERSGYRHIYMYAPDKTSSDKRAIALTEGNYEVTDVLGVDEKNKKIYFTSNEISPFEDQLYVIDFSGKNKKRLTPEKGSHDITFSPSFKYYVDSYSEANRPPVTVLKETATGSVIQTLADNAVLTKKLSAYEVSPSSFFRFKASEGLELNAWIIKPIGFDSTKKYPVLMTVYGGPGVQTVSDRWNGFNYVWYQILAQKGYIVISVDGRGTGGRGAAFKKITQLNLGKYETEDLISTAKYLGTLPYVDKNRIGIFGWSFGGYLSSLAITKGSDYFKTAIAVAPVTNWRYYDNIYTERYMGLPAENAKGYDDNSPVNFAKLLKGNYLLIHGTADDNVHIQNAIEMERALIKSGKTFEMFHFPDRNHGIYGGVTRYYLYRMLTEFIERKL